MVNITPWAPFESDGDNDFFDPYEGRKVTNSDAFFEDPFANRLPGNGWCRVPCRFAAQTSQTRRRCGLQLAKRNKTRRQVLPNEPNETVSFASYHSCDSYPDEGETDEDSDPSMTVDHEQALCTIDEDAALCDDFDATKAISMSTLSPDADLPMEATFEDMQQIAAARAFQRVQQWLNQTGLVDELNVDPKTLPQNRYCSDDSVTTTKSQEGFEVGRHGLTLEGDARKIDAQFCQFKVSTLREVDKIDDKLVEHQRALPESLKHDIKELPPIVGSTLNARSNIGRVLAEVECFQNILPMCDRLALELTQTGEDWSHVKDIAQDHVNMQSFLVRLALAWNDRPVDKKRLDHFLAPSIKAVRELGNVIRSKLLGGIGQAFGEGQVDDISNLVGAMQLYESEERKLHDIANQPNAKRAKFILVTGIRKIAMERILEDCDRRGQVLFQSFQEEAANDAVSSTAQQVSFDAVIQACETMIDAIDIVKQELIPLFPPSWEVFPIWAACVGAICSQHLLQRIGGRSGSKLPFLTASQLVKSLVWIETFCEKVGLSGMNINGFEEGFFTAQDLMTADMGKTSLDKVGTLLWSIHRPLEDQFLVATRVQTNQWLDSVCAQDHCKSQTTEGRLITSLPEDLWVLASAHLSTIRERFSRHSMVFFHASKIIFDCIKAKERSVWRCRHEDLETCCAAANDALRMIELAEVEVEDIKFESDLNEGQVGELDALMEQLSTQFLQDAVFSAKSIHFYVFGPIREALAGRIFEPEWENMTENDMAFTIVRTLDDYLGDMEKWLEHTMLRKAIDSLVRGTVVYYVRALLYKSIRRRKHTFEDTSRALQRMSGDIATLDDFFEGWVEKFPPLARVLEVEFETLYAIVELLEAGLGRTPLKDPTKFFPFFLQKIGHLDCTKFLCCQLWQLLSTDGGRKMREMFDSARDDIIQSREMPVEEWDADLQLDNMILHVMDDLRDSLKVKSKMMNARQSLVVKAGNIKRRASRVIDRVVDA